MTTAPSPGLGEREAVARTLDPYAWECWEEIQQPHYGSYGLSGEPEGRLEDSTCARWQHAVRGAGMLAKSLAKADAIIAEHIQPLRTDNETLRAERDAAIARAEEAERDHTDMMWQRRRADERAEAAEKALADLKLEIELNERPLYSRRQIIAERDAALTKLAQAEGEIATMRTALESIKRVSAIWVDPGRLHTDDIVIDGGSRHHKVLVLQEPGRIAHRALTNPESPHGD